MLPTKRNLEIAELLYMIFILAIMFFIASMGCSTGMVQVEKNTDLQTIVDLDYEVC